MSNVSGNMLLMKAFLTFFLFNQSFENFKVYQCFSISNFKF